MSDQPKKLQNLLLTPENRAEQFPADFCLSADVLFCKLCQQNVEWKGVDMYKDHLGPKSVWKNN